MCPTSRHVEASRFKKCEWRSVCSGLKTCSQHTNRPDFNTRTLLNAFIDTVLATLLLILCNYVLIFTCIIFYLPLFYRMFISVYFTVTGTLLWTSVYRVLQWGRSARMHQSTEHVCSTSDFHLAGARPARTVTIPRQCAGRMTQRSGMPDQRNVCSERVCGFV